ncbi:hypothetical protein O9H85_18285 [Paenibacillus filicis]|uniref:TIR domain-containing protein n=1 Tax=Paenibacillus gyeongsangnamensis TaxID=3388067 RepID=A0ABT4QBS5_9BACL|nr:hypothetical protein [Paenibacillus filicis]MCZ8514338.1 hypothetical protein [Paenibacillus filicis]
MKSFIPPLSIYFIWHPADDPVVKPYYEYCFSLLSRDVNKPFSRSMNLPFFYRTSTKQTIPSTINLKSKKTMIFVFVGTEMVADYSWSKYLQTIDRNENNVIIPVALDKTAFSLNELFGGINFIRSYEFDPRHIKEQLFISISHEIYRFTLNESSRKLGKENALKLFLSHAKDGNNGVTLAKSLKSFIDNSSMRNFFDATDISPGYKFDEEIIGHIQESTLIAIHTDSYSSRYWCQREILCAKENNRPMLAVDLLEQFEDRRFPFASNIPGIHINLGNESPSDTDLLRILSATLLETIRFFYSYKLLEEYKNAGWIESDAVIFSRPPEVSDIEKLLIKSGDYLEYAKTKLIYPEPPLYIEELSFLNKIGIQLSTPITIELGSLANKQIGISISDPSHEDFVDHGITNKHLVQLSQDIARHLLSRGVVLNYGGDLREDGFTDFLFNEALALQARTQQKDIHINNFIAWPIYTNDGSEMKIWKAKYRTIAKMAEVPPPTDVKDLIPKDDVFLPPTNSQNLYVWSRSLSEMRKIMINQCNVRICAGGRHSGYKGRMPGVLEEIMIAIEHNIPLYLIGGFGGVTASVCEVILGKDVPKELTETWQIENNPGYKDLLNFISQRDRTQTVNYDNIINILRRVKFNNGLNDQENEKLFTTQFIDEAIYLVFKGFKKMYSGLTQ